MSRVQIFRRKAKLNQRMSDYNRIAMRLSERLHELHKYSAAIARGYMTPFALAGMPLSCLSMGLNYFANQFSPDMAQRVKARLFMAGQASNNADLKNQTNIRDDVSNMIMDDSIKCFQDKIIYDFNPNGANSNLSVPMYGGPNCMPAVPGAFAAAAGLQTTPLQNTDAAMSQQAAALDCLTEKAYKEELKEMQKAEAENLKVIEDEIQQEKLANDHRMAATKEELQGLDQAEGEAIKRSTPKYA